MQPSLKSVKTRASAIREFKGLCLRDAAPDGYFADAENLTAAGYPVLAPRRARGVANECAGVTAMYENGEMCWLEGTNLYYGSSLVGELTAGEKQFASLGAYVAIFPDKKLLNTVSLSLTGLENAFAAEGAVASVSNADGSAASDSNYAKIAASGIGAGFRKGDGVAISGFSCAELNGTFVLQTVSADFIVIIAALAQGFTENGEITIARQTPDMDYVCALGNRVWGCSSASHAVYACKLGDPTNWNVFEGVSTDSYAVAVASPGDFTGCAAFLGSAMFFKEEEIIKLFGAKPSNFQLISSQMPGVERGGGRSLACAGSLLCYKGASGVYAYDGSTPTRISQALGRAKFESPRAGALEGRYYISMYESAKARYRLFVYDTDTGIWQRENAPQIHFFASTGGNLYFSGADGKIYSVNGVKRWYDPAQVIGTRQFLAETNVAWYAETGPIPLETPDKQYMTRLHVRFSLPAGASLNVSLKYSGDTGWTQAAAFSAQNDRETATAAIPVHAHRADSVFLKLSGEGGCAVHALYRAYETGSDL